MIDNNCVLKELLDIVDENGNLESDCPICLKSGFKNLSDCKCDCHNKELLEKLEKLE